MRASVIIRSRDEADRLRLALTSLAVQMEKAEIVVVNDGSTDHTREVIDEAASALDLVAIHNAEPVGRSSAANAGAAKATGDTLLFLDGDTLASPDLVAHHMNLHRSAPRLVVRGETWHLRSTRSLLNPETGTPKDGEAVKVLRMSENERQRSLVTRRQIREAFTTIDARAQPGIYPGFGPRKLLELEMDALHNHPDCTALWAAASGSNQSMSRSTFLETGGFHPEISINEHRELALRLCEKGLRMVGTSARTYHMVHRVGWRDPLQETSWEEVFYHAHPIPEVALLPFFWASLSEKALFPPQTHIRSIPELAKMANNYRSISGFENVRNAHLSATLGFKGNQ